MPKTPEWVLIEKLYEKFPCISEFDREFITHALGPQITDTFIDAVFRLTATEQKYPVWDTLRDEVGVALGLVAKNPSGWPGTEGDAPQSPRLNRLVSIFYHAGKQIKEAAAEADTK